MPQLADIEQVKTTEISVAQFQILELTMSDTSTEKKSGLIDWSAIPEQQKRVGGNVNFLRLKSGNDFVVRLFHKPKPLFRYYNPACKKSALTDDPENCPIKVKGYVDDKGKKLKPKERFAINVIDRADPGMVKVMEAPKLVFLAFKDFYENIGIDPGGPDACDFVISVTGSGIETDYKVKFNLKEKKPFTAEEKAMLREKKYDLDDLFKPNDPATIEADLGLIGPSSQEAPEKSPALTTAGESKGKDEFDWGA